MTRQPFRDEFNELQRHGHVLRVDAVRVLGGECRCEIDISHRSEGLQINLTWNRNEDSMWSLPDGVMYERWPHLFNRESALLLTPFDSALIHVAAAMRNRCNPPSLPVDLNEEDAIALSHRWITPADLPAAIPGRAENS